MPEFRPIIGKPDAAALAILKNHFNQAHPEAGDITLNEVAFPRGDDHEGGTAEQKRVVWDGGRQVFKCALCPNGQVLIADPEVTRALSPEKPNPRNRQTDNERRRVFREVIGDLESRGLSRGKAIDQLIELRNDNPTEFRSCLAEKVPALAETSIHDLEQHLRRWIGKWDASRRTLERYTKSPPEG